MTARFWIVPFLFTAGLTGLPSRTPAGSPAGTTTQAAQQNPPPGADQDQTTIDDQVDLAVTVYNSDLALVRDVRNVRLRRGVGELQFADIAATVNPATVHFR